MDAIPVYGSNWAKIAEAIGTKSENEVASYFDSMLNKI